MTPNVAASARARLLNQALRQREEFERTLVRYADERLVYRIGACAARDRCVLKGASLLTVWMPDPHRATRDVDVLMYGSSNDTSIRAFLEEVCAVPCPEDGLRFDLAGLAIDDIREGTQYVGRRARFVAYLGSARIRLQMDFGFGDALPGGPVEVQYPVMLEGTPPPRVRGYTREASVAEKFESMVALDTRNSRMKDFHDLWALSSKFPFAGEGLSTAVDGCFERRGTVWSPETPRVLTAAFYQAPEPTARWRAYLTAGGVIVSPPTQFDAVGERIVDFLDPIRTNILSHSRMTNNWRAGGPWEAAATAESAA